MHRRIVTVALAGLLAALAVAQPALAQRTTQEEIIRGIIATVPPLQHPLDGTLQPIRGSRLDAWLPEDDAEAREVLTALNDRGVALTARWRVDNEGARALALRLGRLQQELGLPVSVHATAVMTGFFEGDPSTLHVADDGSTFSWHLLGSREMGCPFRLQERAQAIRARWQALVDAYREAGVRIDLVSMDWYSDGPIEWNEAWEASKRCTVCREHIPDLDDFCAFQEAVRRVRGELQRTCAVEVVRASFPDALIGNWAVHPHDGWRYWYDSYEELPEGAPFRRDQLARYRTWADEFAWTGYTYANPVCYPWNAMYPWYPDYPTDYRWFFLGLLSGSTCAQYTPAELPLITWVKWRPTPAAEGAQPAPAMSPATYRELLAHLLLRGGDGFMMWCRAEEAVDEVGAIAPALDEALTWREFLAEGEPVLFDVPRTPGTVVSALRLGDRLLVRRTDFEERPYPVERRIGGVRVSIPPAPGRYQVIDLPRGE